MFDKNQREIMESVLLDIDSDFDLEFHRIGRVIIRQEITDPEVISQAQSGIFCSLKPTALLIWDALGSTRSFTGSDEDENEAYDIEFFVVFTADGKAYAHFEIFPDMDRVEATVKSKQNPRREVQRWTTARSDVLLKIVSVLADNATDQEIEEITLAHVKEYYIGKSVKRAALMMQEQVVDIKLKELLKDGEDRAVQLSGWGLNDGRS